MEPIDNDAAPKTAGELREEFREYLRNFPDFEGLVAAGRLREVGGGWYESEGGRLSEDVGRYMGKIRTRRGKVQFKPIKLNKELRALKDSL